MLHRRWSNKVALPVGPLWGNTGERGVAGCMTWDYGCTNDEDKVQRVPEETKSTYPKGVIEHTKYHKTKYPKYLPKSQKDIRDNAYENPKVEYESKLEDMYSSRSSGALKVGPPTRYDKEKQYFYTKTTGPAKYDKHNIHRGTPAAVVPFCEDIAIKAIRGYVGMDERDGMMAKKPPQPPNSVRKNTSRTPINSQRGRKVEFRDGGSSTRRVATPNGYPSARARANDEMGRWQDAVDDLLLQKASEELYTQPNSSILKNGEVKPDYFELWRNTVSPRIAQTTPIPTPIPSTYRSTYTEDPDLEQHRWAMSQFRRSAKPRVDTHWERDPYQNTKSRPDSRVKVNLECPEDSDMTVSVRLHNNKGWRY